MFGKNKCTLCGGRVSRGICTECGLDNTRTRMYQETEFLSEDQKDQMYEQNHTQANKQFFEDLKKSDTSREQETYKERPQYNRSPQGRPPQGRPPHGRPPQGGQGQEEQKKPRSIMGTIIFIYVVIYLIINFLNW